MKVTKWNLRNGSHGMEVTERKQPERKQRSGSSEMETTGWKSRSGTCEMDATERKPPDTSSQTQATMQLYDTVALWHDGRSYSSRIMIPSIGGTVTLICF